MDKRRVRRIGVFSAAKMQGFVGFIIGLLIGIVYAVFALIFGVMAGSVTRDSELGPFGGIGLGVLGAILALVGFPIFYSIICFIGGAIGALVYNGAARIAGGVELEFESAAPIYSAPPAPQQQWAPNPYPPGR